MPLELAELNNTVCYSALPGIAGGSPRQRKTVISQDFGGDRSETALVQFNLVGLFTRIGEEQLLLSCGVDR